MVRLFKVRIHKVKWITLNKSVKVELHLLCFYYYSPQCQCMPSGIRMLFEVQYKKLMGFFLLLFSLSLSLPLFLALTI